MPLRVMFPTVLMKTSGKGLHALAKAIKELALSATQCQYAWGASLNVSLVGHGMSADG